MAKLLANQLPTATANSYTVAEGGTLNGNVITDNTGAGVDSDPEGDTLTASVVDGPLHGSLVLNPNGSFTYTPYDEPASNFADSDSFTYQLSDGKGGTDTATVTITVTPDATNEAPVNSVPGAQSVDQDSCAGILRGQRQPHPAARRCRRQHDRTHADCDQRYGHAGGHDRSDHHRRCRTALRPLPYRVR